MSPSSDQLWDILLQAGMVQGTAPTPGTTASPWFVKSLLAFSGWLAAIFLFGFVGVGFQFVLESGLASLVAGAMMIGIAYVILRIPKNEFIEHLALAVSTTGQALVIWGLYEFLNNHGTVFWSLITLHQAILMAFMPNDVHRALSSYGAAMAFFLTLSSMGIPYLTQGIVMLAVALVWCNEFRYPQTMRRMRAIGYGLVIALIHMTAAALFSNEIIGLLAEYGSHDTLVPPWIGEVVAGGVMLCVVLKILQKISIRLSSPLGITILIGTVLFGGVSLEATGLSAGMLIILLGFAGGNRVLQGLGIAALLFYSSSYYYLLDTTLLAKSVTMLMVGVVLLAVRGVILHIATRSEEANRG